MTIKDKAVANLITVEGTPDNARSQAMTIAAETSREHTPVRVFQQGNRTMLSAVLPVRVLKSSWTITMHKGARPPTKR